MEYIEEIPKYKKKSKAKTPKKADHRHIFEPCVIEYICPYAEFTKEQGFKPGYKAKIDGYCPICGKIGTPDMEPWLVKSDRWYPDYGMNEPSESALRELNPKTRTLPTFDIGDDWIFAKFVNLEG